MYTPAKRLTVEGADQMTTRGRKIVSMAAEVAASACTAHLFRMDGLGLLSAMADHLVTETLDVARDLGMSEDDHDVEVAYMLCRHVS
jgi:hypothetical protein